MPNVYNDNDDDDNDDGQRRNCGQKSSIEPLAQVSWKCQWSLQLRKNNSQNMEIMDCFALGI